MSWCKDLKESIKTDSKWKPIIIFPSSHALLINNSVMPSSCNNFIPSKQKPTHVDIVEFFNPTNFALIALMKSISLQEGYPSNALFHFEGYNSLNEYQRLIVDIKEAAFNNGTILNNNSSYNKSQTMKHTSYTLVCEHFGKPSVFVANSKQFEEGRLQANNTIIQQHHSCRSVKHSSRHAKFKRVNNHNSNIKTNRSKTKKCTCTFQLSVFFDSVTSRWFLKPRRSKTFDHCFHFNHIYVPPKYMLKTKRNIPPDLRTRINKLITFGNNSSSIVSTIRGEEGINIDYDTIFSIKIDQMKGLLEECSDDPSCSAVTKLIKLFQNSDNVSFVYILHRYNSGFVTFRKTAKEKRLEKLPVSSLSPTDLELVRSTKNWRDSLTLSKKQGDILVAFAWCHDEELRNAEMYPEFLASDITFGVNTERRDLLLVCGIDGRNRIFTAFRCFIPSKQEQAYTWIFDEALPHLLTNKVLKYNLCLASDNERSLVNAQGATISSTKEAFKHTTLRLDCFHAFVNIWRENIKIPDSIEAKEASDIMYKWIMSWFRTLETQEELDISLNEFNQYFASKQKCFSDKTVEAITKLIVSIINKKSKLLHPYFKYVCTFDFLGDTIVECANNSLLKRGPLGVSSQMKISTSGLTQMKAAKEKNLKETLNAAKTINSSKTWTKSLTKEYLTDYAEGLACSNFDNRCFYTKRRISSLEWLVCSSHIFDEHDSKQNKSNNFKHTSFQRVRSVTIDSDNYMSCSCGYHMRWLMPCVHMCRVLDDMMYYTPDLFHIRWWKHYHFIYKRDNNEYIEHLSAANIQTALSDIRNNHFNQDTGMFKGICLDGNQFLENINDTLLDEIIINKDFPLEIMTEYIRLQNNGKPQKTGTKLFKHTTGNDIFGENLSSHQNFSCDFEDKDGESNKSFDCMLDTTSGVNLKGMGAGSQTLSQLSEYRDSVSVFHNTNSSSRDSINPFETLNPMFHNMLRSIKTENQLNVAINAMEKLTFELLNVNNQKRMSCDDDMTFLGEVDGPKTKETRYKYHYER